MNNAAPNTVWQRDDAPQTAQQKVLETNTNRDADKRGGPGGVDITRSPEKPR